MADVHVHNDRLDAADRAADSGIAMLVFTIIAILAVAAFAFLAFNGALFQRNAAPAGTNIDVDVPAADLTPNTNPGATTPAP